MFGAFPWREQPSKIFHPTLSKGGEGSIQRGAGVERSILQDEQRIDRGEGGDGEKLQKQRPEEIGSSGQTTRENHHRPKEMDGQKPTNGNTAPKDCKEPATNDESNAVPVADLNNDLQEADEAIKRLNELGLGENISSEEFLTYIDQLNEQPIIDTSIELDDAQVTTLYFQHARYRLRYYKVGSISITAAK